MQDSHLGAEAERVLVPFDLAQEGKPVRRAPKLVGISCASLLAVACTTSAKATAVVTSTDTQEPPSESIVDLAHAGAKRIEQELATGQVPSWAGIYTSMDEVICASPREGVAWLSSNCLGSNGANVGRVTPIGKNALDVTFLSDPSLDHAYYQDVPEQQVSSKMYFVSWGRIDLMVPESRMRSLCNTVNSGLRRAVYDQFLVRLDDRKRVGNGVELNEPLPEVPPLLPEPWDDWILKAPVTAIVIQAGSSRSTGFYISGEEQVTFLFQVNAGQRDGMKRGMALFRGDRWETFAVVEVGPSESWVEYRYAKRPEVDPKLPLVGDTLSTNVSTEG